MNEWTPDWDFWSKMATAEVWECACLAANIEPNKSDEWGSAKAPDKLWKIRAQALSHIEHKLLPVVTTHSSPHRHKVRLSDFASWAIGIGHELPREFPRQLPSRTVTRWPWGDYETKLLREMAEAAKQFWSTYDPDQPDTAPRNKDVVDWLTSHGVSKKIADAMATILRADELPMGPRPSN